MIDYQKDKTELLRRIATSSKKQHHVILDAWGYGKHHLHIFDALDSHEDQLYGIRASCGCITQVKSGEKFPEADKRLGRLIKEIKNDPLIPSISHLSELPRAELVVALDRFIYYQEAADKLLGRSLT